MQKDNSAEKYIKPNSRLSSHERLEIYAQQYWWRVQGSMDEDYSIVKEILREKLYTKIRDQYLNKYKSTSFTLRNLGAKFPRFLKLCKLVPINRRGIVYDAATYEWAVIESFDSAKFKDVSKKKINEDLKIVIQPHAKLVKAKYPVHILKNIFIQKKASSEAAKKNKVSTKTDRLKLPKPKLTYLVVFRDNENKVRVKVLDVHAYKLLSLVTKQTQLGNLIKLLPKSLSDAEVAKLFQLVTSMGLIHIC